MGKRKDSKKGGKKPPVSANNRKGSKRKQGSSPSLSPDMLQQLLETLLHSEAKVEPAQAEETESWLDWAIDLIKTYGPLALEYAPELLAMLA